MSTKGKRKPGRKDARGRNAASADLSLDDDEVFRIINQTDLMGGPAASLGGIPGSTAYKIMRPSELDAMRERQQQQQQQHPVNGSGSAGGKARKPLVELVDGDEANEDKGADDQDEEGTEGQEEEEDEHDDEPPIGEFGEEMFRLALNLIVFGTLWLCLDMMVHAQYGQENSIQNELGRAVNVVPGLAFVIYFTSHYADHPLAKLSLVGFATVGAAHMVWCVASAGYLQVMRRAPVLGVLWVWSIVQLDLTYALATLAIVAAYVKIKGLKIIG